MKKKLFVFLFLSALISSCSPSQGEIQTAIFETDIAQEALYTNTPEPTNTPLPTETPTVTPTGTPTATPLPTATPDIRIIVEESRNYLCEVEDLPTDGNFYIYAGPHTNTEEEDYEGLADETGEIEWWLVLYLREKIDSLIIPDVFNCLIIRYDTAESARIALTANDVGEGWESITNIQLELGDYNAIHINKTLTDSGYIRVQYQIDITYRNYRSMVRGSGWEGQVTHEVIEEVARNILAKLEAAPLQYP